MKSPMSQLIGFIQTHENVQESLQARIARLERDCECLRHQLSKERSLADARGNALNSLRRGTDARIAELQTIIDSFRCKA